MKLKYIFLSLLTFATLSGCDNEELIGPGGNNNNQGEGLPAVLMINGSTNENVETKGEEKKKEDEEKDKDNSADVLYVFVYDLEGNFLAKGRSDETVGNKAQKVADVLYSQTFTAPLNKWSQSDNGQDKIAEDIQSTSPNDVIVSGNLLSGQSVDVILIANPTQDIEKIYDGNPIYGNLSKAMANLDDQIEQYETSGTDEKIGHSTACQRITITDLKRGINYLGKNKYASQTENGNSGHQKRDWWTGKYNDQIPLYRLISAVRFNKIDFRNVEKGCFILTKAYLSNAYSQSYFFPGAIDISQSITDFNKLITNSDPADNSRNLIQVEETDRGVLIETKGDNNNDNNTTFQYKGGNTVIDKECSLRKKLEYSNIAQDLYSFEGGVEEASTVTLVMEGYYSSNYSGYDDVVKTDNYCKYEVKIENFRRNYIYNVSVDIFGKGSPTDGGEDISGIPKNINAMIEIAEMAKANPVFEFGGN